MCVTEALLDTLSSSVAGGATPLRERGDEAGALRRDFRGFDWKSSYSSANEKRSLYLDRDRDREKERERERERENRVSSTGFSYAWYYN